jgi:hydroxypyruvate isomerase
MNRRDFVAGAAVGAGVSLSGIAVGRKLRPAGVDGAAAAPTARFKHSVCRWPFADMSVDALARAAAGIGLQSVELLDPGEWATVKQHGLTCAVGYAPVADTSTRLTKGFNRREHHAWLLPAYRQTIPQAAAAGVPNLICFSGNREGLGDDEGLENCAVGLRQLMADAERHRVTIVMELLNSKVDHKDYQADRTAWGAALVKRVGSGRFKLLYDIYHMQIMEGDVIRTIRDYRDAIGHYHTAGVPGRHEIDGSQELHYPAVMRAIAETGFTGFVAQEFIPTRDPMTALAEAVRLCRV